jgi:hypothetical protein
MKKSAAFSLDRKRRFDLVRDWRDEDGASQRTVLFGLLNPSKAGERDDDMTVRKGIGFSRRWGFGRMVFVNLNPIVSTDPWDLPYWSGIDPQNRAATQAWMQVADMVVVAWGRPPLAICRNIGFGELVYAFRQIAPKDLYCIGLTKAGYPLHPSRAAYTDAPTRYSE